MKRIPIQAAKDFCKKYDQDQAIIISFDKKTGKTHVITYGKTVEDCKQAANGGNLIKEKILGWDTKECIATPKRAKWNWKPTDKLLTKEMFEKAFNFDIPVWVECYSPNPDDPQEDGFAMLVKATTGYYLEPHKTSPRPITTSLDIEPDENGVENDDGFLLRVLECEEKKRNAK